MFSWGLSSYDTLITTITATSIIISTRKTSLLLYQKDGDDKWMFCYGFKYTISEFVFYFSILANALGKKYLEAKFSNKHSMCICIVVDLEN